jgi:hypothetical protein
MATKYIVDNVANQTITGNVTINGNLSVTGVTTGNLATYKALLTDVGSQTGTSLNNFGGFNPLTLMVFSISDDNDSVQVSTTDLTGSNVDNSLYLNSIEIRVYN